VFGVREQRAARFRKIELFVDAQEKRGAYLFFELAYVDADGSLRKVYARRGGRERSRVGNRFEGVEQSDLHN
jgi:hypothetical protein